MFGLPLWFWIVNGFFVVGLGLFIFFYSLHNIVVVIRTKTNSFDIVTYTRGRLFKDVTGVEYLKVWNRSLKLPAPTPEALSITSKGKKIVEIEVSTEGASRYIIKELSSGNFKTLNTNDKLFLASEFAVADNRKKKKFSEIVMQVAMWTVPIICLVLLLVYWEDVVQPAKEVALLNQQIVHDQQRILSSLSVLKVAEESNGQIIISTEGLDDKPPTG